MVQKVRPVEERNLLVGRIDFQGQDLDSTGLVVLGSTDLEGVDSTGPEVVDSTGPEAVDSIVLEALAAVLDSTAQEEGLGVVGNRLVADMAGLVAVRSLAVPDSNLGRKAAVDMGLKMIVNTARLKQHILHVCLRCEPGGP